MHVYQTLFIVTTAIVLCGVQTQGKVCHDVDIRNNYTELEKLTNCSVVVGYLHILLIEGNAQSMSDSYSFPELVEIKGYLMIYRVFGLKSLARLFPNLVVITGDKLFQNYALILYEIPNLVEIGLYKLSKITRGSTRIEKCEQLCFVNTLDWSVLGGELHYYNKTVHVCEKCPSTCPRGHCWNQEHCQFVTSDCHSECIGCSEPKSNKHCFACKHFRDGNACVEKCPKNKFGYDLTAQCMTETECYNGGNQERWVFQGKCVNSCPSNYQKVTKEKGWCEKCQGRCIKHCTGVAVNSVSAAQELRGCTHIIGNLHLQVSNKQLADELDTTLNQIEEISGSLRISRSIALLTLNFFQNLTVINGATLENDRYALLVYENQNLYKLWDMDSSKLVIKNGTIGFHYNPQLCYLDIEKLAEKLGVNLTVTDVSQYSNGQSATCITVNLTMEVTELNPTNVTIKWQEILAANASEKLIGYFLYYIKDRGENITIYDGRDLCQGDGWDSIFTRKNVQQITQLEPNTKYAYYIKTFISGKRGDRSQMQYFRTLPDDPSEPLNFEALAIDSGSIHLSWEPPQHPNGELSHYVITGYLVKDDVDFLDQRNYCHVPYRLHPEKKPYDGLSGNISSENCCYLLSKETIYTHLFDNLCSSIENIYLTPESKACQNYMYKIDDASMNTQLMTRRNPAEDSRDAQFEIRTKNPDVTNYVVTNLKHFSLYIFYIAACNKRLNETYRCGPVLMDSQRTFKDARADEIPSDISVEYLNEYTNIRWLEPKNPNSVILAYEIEYSIKGYSVNRDCITRRAHRQARFVYRRKFLPGSYVLRVRAVSLAGPGPLSKPQSFEVYSTKRSTSVLVVIVVILAVALVGVVAVYVYYKRKQDEIHLIRSINPDYAEYVVDEWEMDRNEVVINKELGKGTFGMVYAGMLYPGNIPVAVKTVNETANAQDRLDFLNEASVMKSFNKSQHVVRLMGVVSKGNPPLVVMELMEQGDLKSYLRRSRDSSNNITCAEMYRMAIEIADGMAYLTAKKFVHRDLAARNCMVAADRTVKIGDFGMTRDIYENDYYRKESRGLLPVRWMSPESLADGVFTSDSDVWSYGVVLWEMATLAEQPYQGLSNEQVLQFVIAHGTLERPAECPQILFEIMDKCWKWRPIDRPLFMDIVARLESSVGQDFHLISFYHSQAGEEYRLNAGQRIYNPPAVSGVVEFEGATWNVSDEEISLYPGEENHSNKNLPFSYQRC